MSFSIVNVPIVDRKAFGPFYLHQWKSYLKRPQNLASMDRRIGHSQNHPEAEKESKIDA